MVDKRLDQLPNTTTIAGTNIMHTQTVGGDNLDKHITFSDVIQSIVDGISSGSLVGADYILVQDDGTGVMTKVLASDVMDEIGAIVSQNNTATTSDNIIWTDGTNTHKGTMVSVGDAALRAQASTAVLGTANEIVIIVDGVSKRITYGNIASKLLDNVTTLKTTAAAGDYVAISNGTGTEKITVKNLIKDAVSVLDLSSGNYTLTAQVIVDELADGNATRHSVKNLFQKAPNDLLDTGTAETGDEVLFIDATDGLTKKDTLTNAITASVGLASSTDLEDGSGTGLIDDLVTSALFGQITKGFSTYTTSDSNGRSWSIKYGSMKIGGLIINYGVGTLSNTQNWGKAQVVIDLTRPAATPYSDTLYAPVVCATSQTTGPDTAQPLWGTLTTNSFTVILDRNGDSSPPRQFYFVVFGD